MSRVSQTRKSRRVAHLADLEIGDTAGWETHATPAPGAVVKFARKNQVDTRLYRGLAIRAAPRWLRFRRAGFKRFSQIVQHVN
jgi:hypothetical protein